MTCWVVPGASIPVIADKLVMLTEGIGMIFIDAAKVGSRHNDTDLQSSRRCLVDTITVL